MLIQRLKDFKLHCTSYRISHFHIFTRLGNIIEFKAIVFCNISKPKRIYFVFDRDFVIELRVYIIHCDRLSRGFAEGVNKLQHSHLISLKLISLYTSFTDDLYQDKWIEGEKVL